MANSSGVEITTEDRLKAIRKGDEELRNPIWGPKYMQGINFQRRLERQLLTSYQVCTTGIDAKAVAERLAGLKPEELKSTIQGNFYNPAVMEAAACTSSLLYASTGSMSGNERLREYISRLRQIGAESISGYALLGSLGADVKHQASDVMVVKAPRSPTDSDELVHEAAIGFFGTNQLRKLIPNFAYILGYFECSPPLIDTSDQGKKEVVAWCNKTTGGSVAYVVYEAIPDARSFEDLSSDPATTPQLWMMYYLQVMLAERTAWLAMDWTHYDLHAGNVLLRRVSGKPFYIPYQTSRGMEYILTNGEVASIIDYGTSHITVQGEDGKIFHLGHVSKSGPLVVYGIYRDRSNIIHDVYKLLCMCLSWMIRPSEKRPGTVNNQPLFDAISPLLGFFDLKETPLEIIRKQQTIFYFTPWNEKIATISLDDWIEFCRSYCTERLGIMDPILQVLPAGAIKLGCSSSCLTLSQELDVIGLGSGQEFPVPTTILQFFDAYSSLAFRADTARKEGLIGEAVPLERSGNALAERFLPRLDEAVTEEGKHLATLSQWVQPFIIYQLPRNYDDLANPSILNQIKASALKEARFLDSFQRIRMSIKALEYVIRIYRLPEDHLASRLLQQYIELIRSQIGFRQAIAAAIQSDLDFLNPERPGAKIDPVTRGSQIAAAQDWQYKVESDPAQAPYRWYLPTFQSLMAML